MDAHQQPSYGEPGPSSYPHLEARHGSMGPSPYDAPPMSSFIVSPEMNTHARVSPTAHHSNPQHHMGGHPHHEMMQYQHMPPTHHPQPHQVPNFAGVNYMPMQRHPSIQTTRSESPHAMMGADVFGGPVNAPMLEPPMMVDHSQSHLSAGYEYGAVPESYGSEVPLGISPARALGPAPRVPQPFQTPGSSDSHVTPQHKNNPAPYHRALLSSSDSSSDNSSSVERPVRTVPKMSDASDDENESPTKRVRDRIPTFEPTANPPPKRPNALASRPKTGPAGAGRSSAKLTKVAEDPGVEGIPPGPRSTERPSQSFACIIGQAILKSSAGGLSLEHIYRYVETAYPYFKTVDQWRNSVRHNLSIHKIFVTAPRTEKHPPGKGGIWIIDEAEKIHWPSEDKFIKNFQPSHPHHAHCRQTLHERAQEKKQREKAEAEGRVYVPKKGKRSKLHKQEELKKSEPLSFPPQPQHQMVAPPLPPMHHHQHQHQHPMPPVPMAMSLPPVPQPPPIRGPPHPHMHIVSQPMSPPPHSNPRQFDFEDDSDFVPDDTTPHIPPLRFEPAKDKRLPLAPPPSMAPPRGFPGQENKPIHDDDGVFSTVSASKHTRPVEGDPLSPVQEQAEISNFIADDMFITPSRERPSQPFASVSDSSRQLTSSALKTPALIQTSSSPTSSPMPPTVTRGTHHHPSGLQQAWTQDDMVRSNGASSPARLEAAFDLKPTPAKRDRDDDFHSLAPRAAERPGPPKTPVTRSSAAGLLDRGDRDRTTPRVGHNRTPILKTPLRYGGSPAKLYAPNTVLSTPMWEMNGILDRLDGSPTRTPRSDVPPTSPTHYSLSDAGDSPIAKRRKVATS